MKQCHQQDEFSYIWPKGSTLKNMKITFCLNNKKKTLWRFFMDGVQLPQGHSHFEEEFSELEFKNTRF